MLINLNLSASTPSWLPLPLCSSLAHCRRMSCGCVEYITLRFAQSFILFSKLKKKMKYSKGSSSRHLPVRELRSTILNGICHAPATASPHDPTPLSHIYIYTSYIYLCKNKLFTKVCSYFFRAFGLFLCIFFWFWPSFKFIMRKSAKFILLLPSAASCCAAPFSFVDFRSIFVYF